jgi:uncharacterized protein YdeI (YjbR/CyaY-like superfamily)
MVKQTVPSKITYFESPAELRGWFHANHATAAELWVGFYKKGSGHPSITWPESVDEALCVGWIDGIRKSIDAERYTIRFTPRQKGSIWSAVNIKRVAPLTAEKRMRPGGLRAFEARTSNRSGIYAYEQRRAELEEPYDGMLRKNKTAWDFFHAQPPSYRKVVAWWVMSAKQEETRVKRLNKLIDASAAGRRLA